MNKNVALLLGILSGVLPVMLYAGNLQQEIDHLLVFVGNSECRFERNGKSYAGKEAAEHIGEKYAYFESEFDSAERFIELTATKSTLSGKYYMILCGDNEKIKSKDWMLQELKTYREKL